MAIEVNKLTHLNDIQLLYDDLRNRIKEKYTMPKTGIPFKHLGRDVLNILNAKVNKDNPTFSGTFNLGRKNNSAVGAESIAIGENVIASGFGSYAEGKETESSGAFAHTEGSNTKASGNSSHAEGSRTQASEQQAHAEGYSTRASGIAAHSEGGSTNASGERAHAEGSSTVAAGEGSHAEGYLTKARGQYSHAEGFVTEALGSFQHVYGMYNISDNYDNWLIWQAGIQYNVGDKVSRQVYTSNGYTKKGYVCKVANNDSQFIDNNWEEDKKMNYVEIVGNGLTQKRSNARTLDWDGNEIISNSLTIGVRSSTIGQYSCASGNNIVASGIYSHAEGDEAQATGQAAHAEGKTTRAKGTDSHAEGWATTAEGSNSHAEGHSSSALGSSSHAEGIATDALGYSAHAEGYHTKARGNSAHTEGYYTTANGRAQHVFGEYNILDGDDNLSVNYRNTYVEIVGNGAADNDRSNARTLDWSGNESLAGSLTLGMGTANETTLTAQQTKAIIETSTHYQLDQYVITHGTGIWIQGGIHTNSGSSTSSTHKIHLDRYIDTNNIVKIVAAEGYKFLLCGYEHSTNNFVGIYQPDGWLKTTSSDITWYTSIDVATVGDYILDIMVANNDTSTDISPASLGNGISFYAKRIVSDKEIALYAAENKQLYDEHIWFKPGSISADGSDYTDGNSDYRSRTKASLPIYLDAKPNDKIYFSVLGNDMKIKVVQYNANGTVHSYINWATPEVAMIHVSGCYYRIAIQQADGGAGYHTAEASSFVRIYNYKKPIPNNAAKTNFCVMTYNVGQWYHGTGSVAAYAELPTYENIQRAIIERYSPDILCTQEYTPYIHVLGNYFNNFYYYNPANNDNYVGKMIASNYTQSESSGAVFTTTGSSYRNYAYSYMWLGGRRVCVISAHFIQNANDKTIAAAQLAELKTFADTQTYVIIGVDTNLDCTSTSDQIYIDNFKPWVDDGYHLANMDKFGFMNSIYRGNTWCCCDNIITSNNINIDYACTDNQKNITGIEQDHLPLVAYISFNQ